MQNDIAIFTPMANEEKGAKKFVLELLEYKKLFRKFKFFIIIDNVSTDNTYKIVKKLEKKNKSLKIIWSPKNKSIVDAYMQGYKNCLKTNYNWILEIDAGGSHQPKDLLRFLKFMNNKYDCIYASRLKKNSQVINRKLLRTITSRIYNLVLRLFFNINSTDAACGFKFLSKNYFNHVNKYSVSNEEFSYFVSLKTYTPIFFWDQLLHGHSFLVPPLKGGTDGTSRPTFEHLSLSRPSL